MGHKRDNSLRIIRSETLDQLKKEQENRFSYYADRHAHAEWAAPRMNLAKTRQIPNETAPVA